MGAQGFFISWVGGLFFGFCSGNRVGLVLGLGFGFLFHFFRTIPLNYSISIFFLRVLK